MTTTIYLNSAGCINGVNVIKALRASELDVRIITGDCNPLAIGLFLADKGYVVPKLSSIEFIPKLLSICREEKVDIALPIYSDDFPVFEAHMNILEKVGIKSYSPSKKSWEICSDKFKTIAYLESIGVPCPKTWTIEDAMQREDLIYPLFLKRRRGSGSKNVQIVKNRDELKFYGDLGFVVQELLNGDEFTVDTFSDLNGNMLAASPRKRLKVYGGLSTRGVTFQDSEIIDYSRKIVENLSLPGPSNVQCKRMENGEVKFYDINPRFASGGLPLAVEAGLNSPELLVRMLMGWELPEIEVKEGIYMIRYWDSLFIEESDMK